MHVIDIKSHRHVGVPVLRWPGGAILPNFSLCSAQFVVVFCRISRCVLLNLLLCSIGFVVVFCLSGPPYSTDKTSKI